VAFEGITGTVLVSSGKGFVLDCGTVAGFWPSAAGLFCPFAAESPAAGACASDRGTTARQIARQPTYQRDWKKPSHLYSLMPAW